MIPHVSLSSGLTKRHIKLATLTLIKSYLCAQDVRAQAVNICGITLPPKTEHVDGIAFQS